MKKLKLIFAFLVFSLFLVSFTQIGFVRAQTSTVYIMADGTVVGTDKLQRNDNVYTFTGNISGSISVQKSFITIDGSGYTLQGSGADPSRGIDISNNKGTDSSRPTIVNVTIKDIRILNFATGIHYAWTSNNTILGNYIAHCGSGIDVTGGQNNVLIKLNTFENNTNDITINYSNGGNKIITQNNIGNFVQIWMSDQPTIDMNYWLDYNGTDNDGDGIGDTPYYYHDTLRDSHPLIAPVPVIPENNLTLFGFLSLGIIFLTIKLVYNRKKTKIVS